ncbi:MAG: tRNA uridine-5-carboxymethylaminomethyl(34) synthesis GTPase MnmE [Magnetococcus sp. WYHC-3]
MLSSDYPRDDRPVFGLASGVGAAGVAVVRLSGSGVLNMLLPMLSVHSRNAHLADFPPRHMVYAQLLAMDGVSVLDRGLVVYFPAPRSYTGEDCVELHLHGSPALLDMVYHALQGVGFHAARPGEFSRRAFLNGKMDLVQAEAIMALIHASSGRAALHAQRLLEGRLSQLLQQVRDELLEALVYLEASLDFSEDEVDDTDAQVIAGLLQHGAGHCARILATQAGGRILADGFQLAIVGRPNVGKSSMFNALLGRSRAIVTDRPGTTRDVLEERLIIAGVPFVFLDTAGIRGTQDLVEQMGIERSHAAMEAADALLLVVDGSSAQEADDGVLVERLAQKGGCLVLNKMDLPCHPDWKQIQQSGLIGRCAVVSLSCVQLTGLDHLEATLLALAEQDVVEDGDGVLLVARHRQCLTDMMASLSAAQQVHGQGGAPEVAAMLLRQALDQLAELTGSVTHEDVLDGIFSRFCIGK